MRKRPKTAWSPITHYSPAIGTESGQSEQRSQEAHSGASGYWPTTILVDAQHAGSERSQDQDRLKAFAQH